MSVRRFWCVGVCASAVFGFSPACFGASSDSLSQCFDTVYRHGALRHPCEAVRIKAKNRRLETTTNYPSSLQVKACSY